MQSSIDDIQLSENAILYISSGFDGPYIMQIIVSRAISNMQYQLCLTDGRLYIGGKYISQEKLNLPMYSIVKIQCKFNSRWSPIQITSLEVLSTSIKILIGKSPATLHDYFQDEKQSSKSISNGSFSNSYQESAEINKPLEQIVPRKRVKLTVQPQVNNGIGEVQNPTNLSCQTQKINHQPEINLEILHNAQTQSLKFKSDSQSEYIPSNPNINSYNNHEKKVQNKKNQSKNSKFVFEDKSDSQSVVLITKTQPKIYVASQHEVVINKSLVNKNQTHNVYISDLYERMLRWKILCRIASLRTFISNKGKKCSIMLLIDQKGDQIKAIYYYNKNGKNPADKIQQGKVYSFTGGEVTKPSDEQFFPLQIVLDQKCQITQYQQIFIYPYCAKKCTKYKDLLNSRQLVNILGILKKIQLIPGNSANYNPKPRIKGVICSLTQLYQIEFSKNLCSGQKQQLIIGSVYVLLNFNIVQAQNAIKLKGYNNSFIVHITEEDMQYNKAKNYPQYQQLNKLKKDLKSQGEKWKKYEYYNLSEVKYSKRTIQQMKNIANETDSLIYSQIMVSIADIKLKKQYMACPICKRSTIQQEQILYQCLKCKKIVDPYPTLIISLILADATGSFQVDVIGEKVQIFIGIQASQFCGMSTQDRQCTLLIAKYSQFIVKLKTEKKNIRQLCHSIQEASKQEHTNTMQQIRRRTVEQKLKLQQKWDYFN